MIRSRKVNLVLNKLLEIFRMQPNLKTQCMSSRIHFMGGLSNNHDTAAHTLSSALQRLLEIHPQLRRESPSSKQMLQKCGNLRELGEQVEKGLAQIQQVSLQKDQQGLAETVTQFRRIIGQFRKQINRLVQEIPSLQRLNYQNITLLKNLSLLSLQLSLRDSADKAFSALLPQLFNPNQLFQKISQLVPDRNTKRAGDCCFQFLWKACKSLQQRLDVSEFQNQLSQFKTHIQKQSKIVGKTKRIFSIQDPETLKTTNRIRLSQSRCSRDQSQRSLSAFKSSSEQYVFQEFVSRVAKGVLRSSRQSHALKSSVLKTLIQNYKKTRSLENLKNQVRALMAQHRNCASKDICSHLQALVAELQAHLQASRLVKTPYRRKF